MSKAKKAEQAKKETTVGFYGFDCFNHLVELDGKKVIIHKTGETKTGKTTGEALAIFHEAVSNSQFQ